MSSVCVFFSFRLFSFAFRITQQNDEPDRRQQIEMNLHQFKAAEQKNRKVKQIKRKDRRKKHKYI